MNATILHFSTEQAPEGSMGDHIAAYLAACKSRNLAESTIHRRAQCLHALRAALGPDLHALTGPEIEEWVNARRHQGQPLSAKSRYGWISNLAAYYSWCVRRGLEPHDPTTRIDRPRVRDGLPRPISDDDLAVAHAAAEPDLRCWIELGALAGLRIAEIAGVSGGDVVDDKLFVVGKGRKERVIPLHPILLASLRPFLSTAGRVFRRPHGGWWPAKRASDRMVAHFRYLGMPWGAHNLRHWFGTSLIAAGVDLRTVQELMGHAKPTTTAIYTRVADQAKSGAVERLALPMVA